MERSLMYLLITKASNMFSQKKLNLWHRRWEEYMKEYDLENQYRPGKATLVAYACKSVGLLTRLMVK